MAAVSEDLAINVRNLTSVSETFLEIFLASSLLPWEQYALQRASVLLYCWIAYKELIKK